MLNTDRVIKLACMEKMPISLVINKIDRLVLELKVPLMHLCTHVCAYIGILE